MSVRLLMNIGLSFWATIHCTAALSQEASKPGPPELLKPRFVTIPLDENDADVKSLRMRVPTTRSYDSISRRSFARGALETEKRFLAAIDLSRIDVAPLKKGRSFVRSLRSAVSPKLVQHTKYGKYSFETIYPDLNVSLDCHWAYDANNSARLAAEQAKFDEEELEEAYRRKQLNLPPEGYDQTKGTTTRESEPADPERNFVEKERQFKVAGRPCLLQVVCTRKEDPICEDSFVDALAKNVITVRLGE